MPVENRETRRKRARRMEACRRSPRARLRADVAGPRTRLLNFRVAQVICLIMCAHMMSAAGARAGAFEQRASIAVLDLGESETGRRAADEISGALAKTSGLYLVNRGQARAAARGVGYAGSLNLTLAEARDLGEAIGCDFYFTGEAQTVRRTSSARAEDYFESSASLFLVSAKTGKLVLWEAFNAESATPAEAEKSLLSELRFRVARYAETIPKAQTAERNERLLLAHEREAVAFEDVPDDGSPGAVNFRAPQPYRSLRPSYPDAAARVAAEASVDVLVWVDAGGEVKDIEIMRWAGYGLNEAVIATVRGLHFRPATRDGQPVPVRVLLRYNFRRPAEDNKGKHQ